MIERGKPAEAAAARKVAVSQRSKKANSEPVVFAYIRALQD